MSASSSAPIVAFHILTKLVRDQFEVRNSETSMFCKSSDGNGAEGGSGGGSSGRTRDEALHCPERLGAVPGIGRRDGGVASQRVGRPLSLPRIGLHDGAAHGDHGGVG